jgi:hypothetical protein
MYMPFAGANLTAVNSQNGTCVEAPSLRLNVDNITVLQPGPGFCGSDGSVPAGSYGLLQRPPANTIFLRCECYDITNGTAVLLQNSTTLAVSLAGNVSVTCVAVYDLASATPSPSPRWAWPQQ